MGADQVSMKQYRSLIFIILLVIVAIWIDLPSNTGIEIGQFNRDLSPRLGLDLVGGVQALLEADLPEETNITPEQMQTARTIVENRVNGLGVTEAVVQLAGDRRIVVELPGETNPDEALAVLRQTGLLEFVDMGSTPLPEGTVIQTDFGQAGPLQEPTAEPTPSTTTPGTDQVWHTVMTGAALESVSVVTGQAGEIQVAFTLTPEGSQTFAEFTTNNVGRYLAIVLDNSVISVPQINTPITEGSGVITGNFTVDTANALAIQLRYGSLPIPLTVVTSQTVGPTLGQDSLSKSLVAGLIGFTVVILFMALYYRLPGILADLALLVYALVTFAIFIIVPVTLTLPGIAGFVLSVGVAVDANILIFERLKEELRSGKKLQQAIDLGWARAWPSIRDSNLSTLITCAILFWFGSTFGASIVKGFSLTLAVGVVVSMFTAIIVTRTFLHIVLDNIDFSEHHTWFGV